MKILITLILVVSLTHCSQSPINRNIHEQSLTIQQNSKTNIRDSNLSINNSDTLVEKDHSIEIKSLVINDKISWRTTFQEIQKVFQIDSTTSIPKGMELSDADKLIYIGNTYFEYFEESHYCEIGVIIFDKKINNLKLNGITLDSTTNPEKLATYFPSCSQVDDIDIHKDEKQYKYCHIDIKDNDMQLLFFFHQDKLRRIDIWYPS